MLTAHINKLIRYDIISIMCGTRCSLREAINIKNGCTYCEKSQALKNISY